MTNFKYDLVMLLQLIEERPCLWNKKSSEYKNRTLREKNWAEICYFIDDAYENKTPEEKKETGEIVQQKWANVRDAFIRSLKIKSGQTAKRKYLYADHLQFLLSCYEAFEADSNISESRSYESQSHEEPVEVEQYSTVNVQISSPQKTNITKPYSGKKVTRTKRDLDYIEKETLFKLKKPKVSESCLHHTSVQSKEENFFTSFLPYITDMSEDEKLDLHMEIIRTIKKIKQKRIAQQPSPSFYAVTSPSTSNTFDSYMVRQQTPEVVVQKMEIHSPESHHPYETTENPILEQNEYDTFL